MRIWTTEIFEEDGATDIIAEYKIMLGYNVSPEEAYQKIEEYFLKDYFEKDDEDVYWLAIALFQWQNGILLENIKEKALWCIDNGTYLERWKESGNEKYNKRKETLQILKTKLLNEVNPRKDKFPKCPMFYRQKTKWKVGDLLAYKILKEPYSNASNELTKENGIAVVEKELWKKYVLLRVVEVVKRPVSLLKPELDYTSYANIMLYDWVGETIPSEKEISKLKFKPIVVSLNKDICEVVSGISLDWNGTKEEKKYAEIIRIGTDERFASVVPSLYMENDGCPLSEVSQFNYTLAQTFFVSETVKKKWHYKS
ncbi:MAG: hypothetical protein ACI4GW_02305 [Lachnospiraceae bacterium]